MANRTKDTDAEVLKEARERFERCVQWETPTRANALEDAKFAAGDSRNNYQWDQAVRTMRAGKPMLTDNLTRQNNLLIVNDARQNKAQIKVTPTGGHATFEAAQVFSGIIRRIEYQSKAVDAYSTAIYHQVETGIGYVRVDTDYADEHSMDLEIYIQRVPDPKTVYLDPDASDYDKADMRYAFHFVDTPRDQYEAQYGEGDMPANTTLDNNEGWNDRDHVRQAEYWRRNDRDDKLHKLRDGRTVRESDLQPKDLAKIQRHIVETRGIRSPEIEYFKICGDRIDERKVWPGKYIPLVPFIGEETIIGTVMDRKGHTRSQIDAQKMLNYYTSSAAEHVALQTKTPYIGTLEAFADRPEWNNANVINYPFLAYNSKDETGQPIERPTREQPPVMAPAYLQGLQMARDALMATTGQYEAKRGAPSNETSGIAIQQRQRAGDVATFHYLDNQAKAIRQVGRICLDLIPHVYDTAQVMKIMAKDGSDSEVHLIPNAPEAHQHMAMGPNGPQPVTPDQAKGIDQDPDQPDVRIIFNPNVGRYDVEADVGPSYGTQRQEAFNALSEIIKASPDLVHVAGDLLFKSADFPLADELAERLKRGVPPQFLGGPPIAVQQIQQQMQMQGQQAHELLGKADGEVAELKQKLAQLETQLKDKGEKLKIDDYAAETDRLAALGSVDPMLVQMISRQLWQNMMNTDITPHIQNHAQLEQALQGGGSDQDQPAPPDPMAAQAQGHQQMIDRAKLGLAAQAQAHSQQMDIAQHGLAVQQAQQPQAPAGGP